MPRRYYGYTPVRLPCGWRNPLCLQGFGGPLCLLRSCFGLRGTCLPHPILLAGQPTPLAKPWSATQLRSCGDAGVLLFVSQGRAVFAGGGAQASSPVQLVRRPRVSRFDPKATALLVAWQHIPHPVTAAATPDRRVKTSSRGRAKRARGASAASQPGECPRWLPALGLTGRACFHNSSCDTCQACRLTLLLYHSLPCPASIKADQGAKRTPSTCLPICTLGESAFRSRPSTFTLSSVTSRTWC
jgi:hypothetical protein